MSWRPRSRFSARPPAPPAGDLVAKFHIDLVDDSGQNARVWNSLVGVTLPLVVTYWLRVLIHYRSGQHFNRVSLA